MNKFAKTLLGIIVIIAIMFASGTLYVVNETEQVVITQFGDPVGDPVTKAGLRFKIPFIQKANYFEKRILEWDGYPNQIPTKDKKYIWVDTTARGRISDALKFMQSVGNEIGAHARLDDIIDSATRDFVTKNYLVEAVRNTNRIKQLGIQEREEKNQFSEELEQINIGREKLTRAILQEASKIAPQYGIAIVDVRIKRINYVPEVRRKVFERMISERKRAAEQYRSEGKGKTAEIEGKRHKELKQIQSEAYKIAEEIKGKAEAEAIKIYADAYNKDPEFYSFTKTLETYKNTVNEKTTLVLSTDTEYFEYMDKKSS